MESYGRPFGTERSPILSLQRHAERQTETRGPVERLDRAVEAGGRRRARKLQDNGGRRGSRGARPEEQRAERQADGAPTRRSQESQSRAEAQARRGRTSDARTQPAGPAPAGAAEAAPESFQARLRASSSSLEGEAGRATVMKGAEPEAPTSAVAPMAPVAPAAAPPRGALGWQSGTQLVEGAPAAAARGGEAPIGTPLAGPRAARDVGRSAAPEASASPAPDPAEAQEAQRATRILQQLRLQLHPGLRSATVQLHPAELGRLTIQVRVEEGGVRALVSAESEDALAVLQRHVPELEAAFADQGFQEMAFEFVLDQHASPEGDAWTRGRDASHELEQLVEEELGRDHLRRVASSDVGVDTYA